SPTRICCERTAWSCPTASTRSRSVGVLHRVQHRLHLPVDRVDGLEGPDHDGELDDAALVVAADDVDAVDVLARDRGLELEHSRVARQDLLRVPELAGVRSRPGPGALAGLTRQRLAGGLEVELGDRLAL